MIPIPDIINLKICFNYSANDQTSSFFALACLPATIVDSTIEGWIRKSEGFSIRLTIRQLLHPNFRMSGVLFYINRCLRKSDIISGG